MANLKIDKIQIKRFKSGIKDTVLAAGEFGYDVPAAKLYLGTANGNVEVALDAALQAHIGNGDVHITAEERAKLTGIAAGAQVNVIEKIKLNGTEVAVVDKAVDLGSIATTTALDTKVDKVDGKSLVADEEISKLAGVSTGANKVEKSDTNGNIKIDGAEVNVYTPDTNTVIDGSYKHITVTETSVSDGTTTFTKYDDKALAQRVTTIEEKEATWDGKQDALDGDQLAAVDSGITADKVAAYDETKQTVDNFFSSDAAIEGAIDTLKEIANYIATDKEGAADITARVGALEGKVDVEKVSTAISGAIEAQGLKALAKKDTVATADIDDKAVTKAKLADSVQASLALADTALQSHQDISGKADTATMTAELAKKVDKVTGYSLVADVEIARLAEVDNYNDAEVRGLIKDNADEISAIKNADTGILKQAKDYADSLADNYDAAGAAGTAESNAKGYADGLVSGIQSQIGTKADGKTINGRLDAIELAHNANGAISNPASQPSVLNKLVVENGHVVSGEFTPLESLLDMLTFSIDCGEIE